MSRRPFRACVVVLAAAVLSVLPTPAGAIDFPAGAVHGSILWNGAVVSGSGVPYMVVDIPSVGSTYVSHDGAYSYSAVPPGSYDVNVYANNCGAQPPNRVGGDRTAVVAATTANGDVDISATAGRLVGRITVNGAPLAHPNFNLRGYCGNWIGGDDGTFTDYLPPGTYTADVRSGPATLGSFTFSILAGQTTDVDFGTTPSGTTVSVELSGGLDTPGGIGVTFSTVNTGGSTVVVESGAGPPPPSGYRIVGLGGQPRYWDIDTTAAYSGPIRVCIRYDITQVRGPETQLRLVHDAGDGFRDITTTIDTAQDIICGETTSLSPFAVVESLDGTAPTLHVPASLSVEATSRAGAVVTYAVTATDANPSNPAVACAPTSGSAFPMGPTTVTCSATDAAGNTATQSFVVTVADTTPPVVTVPANVTIGATDPLGAHVSYTGQQATDGIDGPVPVTCSPLTGALFRFGTTTVTCSARDSRGNVGSHTFTVTVTPFTFLGFQQPLENAPAVNTVKNGSTLPFRWRLQGNGGAEISSTASVATGWPKQTLVACNSFTGTEEEISAPTSGATSLRYDPVDRQFVYNWQTPKQPGTCWRLDVKLTDGTSHVAYVKLR